MIVYIKKAVERKDNRVRADFANAVHVIDNLNISDNMVSSQIRVYADLPALKFDNNINDGGKVIMDRHFSYGRKVVQKFIDDNKADWPVTLEDPFDLMKAGMAYYIVEKEAQYLNALVDLDEWEPASNPMPI